MKTQTVVVYAGLAALVLVVAYQFLPKITKAQCDDDYATYCSSGTCELTVTLGACLQTAVTVVPDTLHVCKNNLPLNWTIKTVGYVFDKNGGIYFKKDEDKKDFDKEFWGGTTYSWRDKHGKKNPDIYYGLRILKDGGGPCTTVDPRISND
ncbi:MAG TPA: hypothetical protein VGI48_12595 [Caldimonas sp.]